VDLTEVGLAGIDRDPGPVANRGPKMSVALDAQPSHEHDSIDWGLAEAVIGAPVHGPDSSFERSFERCHETQVRAIASRAKRPPRLETKRGRTWERSAR
jgi:hypothetical protein